MPIFNALCRLSSLRERDFLRFSQSFDIKHISRITIGQWNAPLDIRGTMVHVRVLGTGFLRVVRRSLDKHWTGNTVFVQCLSKLCQMIVQLQGLSKPCPIQVQCQSILCPKESSLDIYWIWRSRICPHFVQHDL